jgi:hypothetical protein
VHGARGSTRAEFKNNDGRMTAEEAGYPNPEMLIDIVHILLRATCKMRFRGLEPRQRILTLGTRRRSRFWNANSRGQEGPAKKANGLNGLSGRPKSSSVSKPMCASESDGARIALV